MTRQLPGSCDADEARVGQQCSAGGRESECECDSDRSVVEGVSACETVLLKSRERRCDDDGCVLSQSHLVGRQRGRQGDERKMRCKRRYANEAREAVGVEDVCMLGREREREREVQTRMTRAVSAGAVCRIASHRILYHGSSNLGPMDVELRHGPSQTTSTAGIKQEMQRHFHSHFHFHACESERLTRISANVGGNRRDRNRSSSTI
jgi:hypothetical protein